MNPQFALFIVFALVKLAFWICKNLDDQPARRYRTRQISEFQNSSVDVGNRPSRIASDLRAFKLKNELGNIAQRLHGEIEFDAVVPHITFSQHGSQFQAYISQQHGAHSIRVLTYWPQADFRMRIFPDQNRTRAWKSFQYLEDLEIGNKSFDEEFVIQGNQKTAIKDLLNHEICHRIQKHMKAAHGRISINVAGNEVEFGGKATRVLGNSQIVSIINNFADIHRLMLSSFAGADIEGAEMVFIERRKSTCMVCGEQVGANGQGVSCVLCDTRHHRDCWNYIGKCSTYGCHSRRAE